MTKFSGAMKRMVLPLCLASLVGGTALVIVSCTKTETTPGGDIFGADDMHCVDSTGKMITQVTTAAGCQAGPDGGVDASPTGNANTSDYGPTMFNQEGFDDDCKYDVHWTASEIQENKDVFFTVVATTTVDNQPATGAAIYAEVYLDDMHEAPPTNQTAVESPPGTYKVGPIRFDAAGAWTVRFHLHEDCKDLVPESPHGHAAFYVNVP